MGYSDQAVHGRKGPGSSLITGITNNGTEYNRQFILMIISLLPHIGDNGYQSSALCSIDQWLC